MNQQEVMEVIGAMNDYADKQNNSGMKNIVLTALIAFVFSIALGVIGYLAKEIYDLRQEKEELKTQVMRLEMEHDAALEEQNKVMFEMIQGLDSLSKRMPIPQPDDDDADEESIVKLPDPEKVKKFKEYHKMFEQRIQNRMPPEQRTMTQQEEE